MGGSDEGVVDWGRVQLFTSQGRVYCARDGGGKLVYEGENRVRRRAENRGSRGFCGHFLRRGIPQLIRVETIVHLLE